MAQERPSRIDAFVDHLMKHKALELVLETGKAALFRFRGGDRSANAVLQQTHLETIVDEIAPAGASARLRAGETIDFRYRSSSGATVTIVFTPVDSGNWRASVVPLAAAGELAPEALELDLAPSRPELDPPMAALLSPALQLPALFGAGASIPAEGSPVAQPPAALGPMDVDIDPIANERPAATGRSAGQGTLVIKPSPAAAASRRATGGEPRLYRYLRKLVALDGSDLHLSADEIPRARVHGEVKPLEPAHGKIGDAELKAMLYEVITERARQQYESLRDADFGLSIPGIARFRANYFEDRRGIGAVFRQIPFEILSPEQLGLPKSVLDLCWLSKGLVVVTGPTGSGKSTTLATLIDYVNKNRTDHIITIEDPIEFVHENQKCLVNQREVGTNTESFKNALRAALREDPDIVLVGEMRDLETIAIAIETAETGHLVFGTLHTTTAASTVDRMIDQFPPDRQAQIRTMLSESLRGVIAQVLCKKIAGGRAAAYEILLTNSAVSNLIRESKTYQLASVMQTARGAGMQTMNDHLFDLVKRKIVHPREAYIKSTDKGALKELFKRENIALDLSGA